MRRAPRRDLATFLRYTRVIAWEFRATLIGLVVCVAVGAVVYAVTPMQSLGGQRPSLMLAALAAWMHLFGEPLLGPSEAWYVLLVSGVYRLVGFTLIAEGVVRFALLMLSRRRGEKEWMKVKASTFRDHVILCGLGHLGWRVLGQLLAQGRQVVCIEKDATGRFLEEAKATETPILVRDMKEDAALEDAGIRHAQAILICTNDDLANLEVALDARRMNPNIRVVMRQYDQQMASKFRHAFSIDYAFSSSALSATTVASMALPCRVVAAFELGEEAFVTAKVGIARRSPFIGRTIAQVEAGHSAQVLSRTRGERSETPPNATAVLDEGDELIVLARASDIGAVAQSGGG
jgi:Trk K+ transport system NAD-binding subunit